MKKAILSTLVTATLALILFVTTGCTSSKSFTYNVTTGDKIEVKLNTSNGYDLTSNVPFKITKDNQTLSQGSFITLEGYNEYVVALPKNSNVKVLEQKSENGLEYLFYSYNDSEYNYVIKISNSNTGILLGNNVSEESAKECFRRLTFTKN